MIVLLDIDNPEGGKRAMVLVPSDTSSAWELYKVWYSPEKGETIDGVGEDHVVFLCLGWGGSLLHAAVDEMMRWVDADGGQDLKALVQRLDDWTQRMEAALPPTSRGA